MAQTKFISDLHLGHRSICKYRTQFSSVEEHDYYVKEQILSNTDKRTKLFILGDIAFDKAGADWIIWLSERMNVELLLGNHCVQNQIGVQNVINYVNNGIKVSGFKSYKNVWLSHCPIHEQELRGKALNVHGHCVDEDTEILTSKGWKKSYEVFEGDIIYSIDCENKMIEDEVLKKHDYLYTGSCFFLNKRSTNMFVTEDHRFVRRFGSSLKIQTAKEVSVLSCVNLITAGKECSGNAGIDLTDNELSLYIALAADGTITETGLGRFRLKKQRKVDFVKNLLCSLGLHYTENASKDSVNINFRTPEKLLSMNIKGLDWVLKDVNARQAKVILDTYRETDGNRNNIYTSKKSEVDILSIALMKNGYSVKVHERIHGFSKKPSYTLSVLGKDFKGVSKWKESFKKVEVTDKKVWCVTTKSGMFFARRNGFAFLTGNCHSNNIQLNGVDDKRYFNVSC